MTEVDFKLAFSIITYNNSDCIYVAKQFFKHSIIKKNIKHVLVNNKENKNVLTTMGVCHRLG